MYAWARHSEKEQGVGSGRIVLGTPGPEGAALGTAARWREAAQAAPGCGPGLGAGRLSVTQGPPGLRVHRTGGPGNPLPQASEGVRFTQEVQPWAPGPGLDGAHLSEVHLDGHSLGIGSSPANPVQGQCPVLARASRGGRCRQGPGCQVTTFKFQAIRCC